MRLGRLLVLACGVALAGSWPAAAQDRREVPIRISPPKPTEAPNLAAPGKPASPRRGRSQDPIVTGLREAQDLLRLNRLDEGLARLRALRDQYPEDWRVTETLGRSLEATDHRDEAIVLFRKSADSMADPGPALIELQRLYRIEEMWPAAVEVCLEYLTRMGDKDAWVADELESLIRTDRAGTEAVAAIEKAGRDDPENARLRELLLLAHLYQGDPLRAMKEAGALDEVRHARGAVLFQYARLAQEKGRLDGALDGYERVLRSESSPALRAQALLGKAESLRGLGRHAEALAAFEEAARSPGQEASARLARADMLATQMGRPEEALAAYRELLSTLDRARTDDAVADRVRLTIAGLQLRLGRPGDAATAYRELAARASEPEARAEALFHAGEMLFFQGKLKEAQDTWYAVTDSFPGQKWINDALEGVLLIGENDDEGGVPLAAYAQAEYQRRLGSPDEGLHLIDEALATHPSSRAADDLLWQKTRLLLDLGRLDDAGAVADSLGARFPDSRLAPRALFAVAERRGADPTRTAAAEAAYLDLITRFPRSLEAPLAREALRNQNRSTSPTPATPETGS